MISFATKICELGKLKKIKQWIISDAMNGLLLWAPKKINERDSTFLAMLALAAVSLVWGTTWVVSRQGVLHMPALQLAGIRQLIGGSIYLGYFVLKKYPLPEKKDLMPLVLLSFLNFVLSNGLSTWGVKYISSGLAAIIGAIFPLWLVIIGLVAYKQKPAKKAIIGMLIGFSGICIIFYRYLPDFVNPNFRFGIALSFIATISWAFGTLYTKKHAKVFNPYFGLGFQMFLAGAILSMVSWFDPNHLPVSEIPFISWFAISYLVIVGSLIGFICYLYALQNLSAEQTSIYAYINPIVAIIAGWLILDEMLGFNILIGCLVTLFGIYLVNRSFAGK
ncbi:MAG: EamA family transporter [Saprospiraceae bacterium]